MSKPIATKRIEKKIQTKGHEIEISKNIQGTCEDMFRENRIEEYGTVRRIKYEKCCRTNHQHFRCSLRDRFVMMVR